MSDAMQNSLIGDTCTAKHVDADELRISRVRDRQRAAAVIAQHVDPKWKIDALSHRHCDGGHVADDMRRNAIGIKRHIAEVLQHQPMDATFGQRLGITQSRVAN